MWEDSFQHFHNPFFFKKTGVKSAFLKFDGKCELNNELLKCYKKVCDVNGSFIILTGISLPG